MSAEAEGISSLRPASLPPSQSQTQANPASNLPQQQRRLQAEPLPRRNLPEVGLSWHCAM